MSTRRELKEELRAIINDNMIEVCEHVRRPCICVVIQYTNGTGERFKGIGFAKVCYPDRWDEDYGVSIAREKAIMDIVRQLMVDGGLTPITPNHLTSVASEAAGEP